MLSDLTMSLRTRICIILTRKVFTRFMSFPSASQCKRVGNWVIHESSKFKTEKEQFKITAMAIDNGNQLFERIDWQRMEFSNIRKNKNISWRGRYWANTGTIFQNRAYFKGIPASEFWIWDLWFLGQAVVQFAGGDTLKIRLISFGQIDESRGAKSAVYGISIFLISYA